MISDCLSLNNSYKWEDKKNITFHYILSVVLALVILQYLQKPYSQEPV